MRVTDRLKWSSLSRHITSNAKRVQETFDEVSTGKRVQRASDDPLAYAMIQRLRTEQRVQEGMKQVGEQMQGYFETADEVLEQATSNLFRARELAIEFGSDTRNQGQRDAAASELRSIKNMLVDLANTRIGDAYVFAGIADGAEPFDGAGTFVGSDTLREVEVGRGVTVSQLSGAQIFGGEADVDTMAVIDTLIADLESGDTERVRRSLGDLDAALDQVYEGRQRAGRELNTIDHARSFSEAMILQSQLETSRKEDVNLPEAITAMQAARTAFEASAQVSLRYNEVADIALRLSN
ncbi:MAG: hypothetical protein AAGI01_01885 [Myxococcota bacterium]